jgi:hypothetical protein
MGRTVRRKNIGSGGLVLEALRAHRPSRAALILFSRAQAPQPIEKDDSARGNPRKSKSNKPSRKARLATQSRFADTFQMAGRSVKCADICGPVPPLVGSGPDFFAASPVQPTEKKRSATLRGGKRRKTAASERRRSGRRSRGAGAITPLSPRPATPSRAGRSACSSGRGRSPRPICIGRNRWVSGCGREYGASRPECGMVRQVNSALRNFGDHEAQ